MFFSELTVYWLENGFQTLRTASQLSLDASTGGQVLSNSINMSECFIPPTAPKRKGSKNGRMLSKRLKQLRGGNGFGTEDRFPAAKVPAPTPEGFRIHLLSHTSQHFCSHKAFYSEENHFAGMYQSCSLLPRTETELLH
eukprot:gene19575-980_t